MEVYDPQISTKIVRQMLEIGAVKLRPEKPFTWASGWKSPIYCDNRLSLSYPQIRTNIKYSLAELVKVAFKKVEAIAGVATAGIPQGALVADLLNLPFLYVRSKAKAHGMENLIEGKAVSDQRTVVLEDLISTGGSAIRAVNGLREKGINVLGVAAIFTYGFDLARSKFEEADIKLICLSDYNALIEEAKDQKKISEAQLPALQDWRKDPENWGG